MLADRFEDFDWDDEDDWDPKKERYSQYEYRKYYDFFVPEITDEKEKAHKDKIMKSFRGLLDASYDYIKNGFKKVLMKHHVYDYEMEDIIADMYMKKQNVTYIYLQDIYNRNEDTYYNRWKKRINIKYDGDFYSTLSNMYHESGHALDNNGNGDYFSYVYKSKKHGLTLSQMMKEEITEDKVDILFEEMLKLDKKKEEADKRYNAGDLSRDEYRSIVRPIWNVKSSIGDSVHACLGYDIAHDKIGFVGHNKGYYNNYIDEKYNHKYDSFEGDKRRGSEFFAEITDDIVNNKHKSFINIMKKVAPKSVEIYYEIMKENYGYGK